MTVRETARSYGFSILARRWLGAWIDLAVVLGILVLADLTLGNDLYQRTIWVWIAIAAAYHPVLEGLTGRTLGKLAACIVVVDSAGKRPGVWKGVLRTVPRPVEVNPFLAGGVPAGLVAALSQEKQRLGDMLAKTYVLKLRDVHQLATRSAEGESAAGVRPGEAGRPTLTRPPAAGKKNTP